ncbi:MAG: transposase [Shewanella sp.]
MALRKGRTQCIYAARHLIFITKYRGKVFHNGHLETLKGLMVKVCADFEAKIVAFNGEQDDVHQLVNYHS